MSIAEYLKEIGRGARGPFSLSVAAARDLMGRVLDGQASATQTGAFVMAMRIKGESLDELVGFLQAVHERCLAVPSEQPVVIVPSYDGSRRLPNLTPLLALWLAREGLPVLVHGPLAEPGRVCTAAILNVIGLAPILQTEDIARAWSRREPAFLPTALLCPPLQTLLDLRLRVGLRGPGHTVARMLNPVQRAPALRLVSHSRAEVGALMSAWAAREGADAQLLPGTEGQPVADPRRQPRIDTWLGGALQTAFSAPAHDGPVAEWPLLPVATDTASAAVYVQEVLSGMRPAPAPLVRQAALIAAAVQALRQRQGALALSA